MRQTQRGFVIFDEDAPARHGSLSLHESSLAGEGAHAWLTLAPPDLDGESREDVATNAVQLDVPGALRLMAALDLFVSMALRGELTEPPFK